MYSEYVLSRDCTMGVIIGRCALTVSFVYGDISRNK